ncbi:hypothetical protein PYW08_002416 [Mythimna loreyi]|uniref:Uncharacterized protein n=1 Tax=Mythimna loreyi TaxID=667449 RepID=A0ACC2R283_9NEOP|nr:hypothetical protein PYW08_002416 [Mythimna loreyi]
MAQTEKLSLSWDAHQKSICSGLSQLQQRGEFVDMTLAADGHHVKVHQMVLSLVSPYIKALISTAQCPNPIIFLNNISYTTLCAILEYVYTGEVLVPKHQLKDVIAAGRALHIRGLKEMDDEATLESGSNKTVPPSPPIVNSISERLRLLKEKKKAGHAAKDEKKNTAPVPICKIYLEEENAGDSMDVQDSIEIDDNLTEPDETTLDTSTTITPNKSNNGQSEISRDLTVEDTRKALLNPKVQYSVSRQGGLQSIYNRYVYQLRYVNKDRVITWRCVDYNKTRCTAHILTNDDDEVVSRSFKHNHTFHDKNILRKFSLGIIYLNFQEASIIAEINKKCNGTKRVRRKISDIKFKKLKMNQKVQYTVSNQGGLQVIHNRYIYHLRYFGKKNRKRLWRCVDYSTANVKCPANICTDENNQVIERSYTHNHPFHDQKILKKLRNGIIYSIFQEAESSADGKKKERRVAMDATSECNDSSD